MFDPLAVYVVKTISNNVFQSRCLIYNECSREYYTDLGATIVLTLTVFCAICAVVTKGILPKGEILTANPNASYMMAENCQN